MHYLNKYDNHLVTLIICFERPKHWINKVWCFLLGQAHSHVRLLAHWDGHYWDTELTWDGFYANEPVEPEQFDIDFAIYYYVHEEAWVQSMLSRTIEIENLHLKWSMAYAIHAFFYGEFPSLTCVSAITYILHWYPFHNVLPSEYLLRLLAECNEQ